MPSQTIIRDPKHPDYPHATTIGARRGCRCEACRRALSRYQKRGKYRRATSGLIQSAPPEVVDRVVAHMHDLLRIPGVNRADIARACGLNVGSITPILDGRRRPSVASAARLLAVTETSVRQANPYVPISVVRHYAGTMQALGYSVAWQMRESGIPGLRNFVLESWRSDRVERNVLERIVALAERVGTRPASDKDGLTAGSRTWSRRSAAEKGYFAPQFYDDDLVFHPEWMPGHEWASADAKAAETVGVADLLVRRARLTPDAVQAGELSSASIARQVGWTVRRVERLSSMLRLGYLSFTPEHVAGLQTILDTFEAGELSAVAAMLRLGVPGTTLPSDHPDLLEWLAVQRAARMVEQDAA